MTIGGWIALGIIVFFILVLNIIKMFLRCKWEFHSGFDDGLILKWFKWLFSRLEILSIGRIIPLTVECKVNPRIRYITVEVYIILWVAFFISLSFFSNCTHAHASVFCVLVSYRLYEMFQSWIGQFILGGTYTQWYSRNIYRSMLLVFIGYIEVTLSYANLAWIYNSHFHNITAWQQAFYYSIRNAVAIGSNAPQDAVSYWLFGTQALFVLLFLTAVVNRIVSHFKSSG